MSTETKQINSSRHTKVRELLRSHNYHLIARCDGPDSNTESTNLEFFSGAKGVLIVQFWQDGGVSTFAEWPLGSTWEQLETAIACEAKGQL